MTNTSEIFLIFEKMVLEINVRMQYATTAVNFT